MTGVQTCALPILLFGDEGEVRELERTAIPLGIVEEADFSEVREVALLADETLFAYTDGVVEARNESLGLFGEERLIDTILQARGERPAGLLRSIRGALDEIVGPGAPQDDMSLLAYRPVPSTARVSPVAAV